MGIGDDILNTDGHPDSIPGTNPDDLANVDQVQPAPPIVAPHNIDVPNSDNPCFAFPHLSLPVFTLPSIKLTLPQICCPGTSAPLFGGGFLANFQLPGTTPGTNYDHNDPRVSPRTSSDSTIVSTPTEPQHISKEISKVAPAASADVLSGFETTLVSAATSAQHVLDFINALGDKAAALGDAGAKALGNGMSDLLNGLGSDVDWATGFQTSGLASAANQAASMTPIRQIPDGIRDPNKKGGSSKSVTSASMRSNWPNQPGGGPTDFIGNALSMGQDLFNAVGGQCLLGAALDSLSRAAGLAAQGLGLAALGMQIDGMLRLGALAIQNVQDGLHQLLSGWRFDCGLKHDPAPIVHKPTDVKKTLQKASTCPTGAQPGNLLQVAYGDQGDQGAGLIAKAPVAIAVSLNSPYTSEIAKFVTDPAPQHDAMASNLVNYYQAGDPKIAALINAMLAFQQVVEFIVSLTPVQVDDLNHHDTEVGGSLVYFVGKVRADAPDLQPIDSLSNNFTANRLTNDQHDLLQQLAGLWDDLTLDFNVVHDPGRLAIAHGILDPRDALGGTRLSDLIASAPATLDNFGGHIGPTVAYSAANQAILTRSLLLVEKSDGAEQPTVNRISKMMKVADSNTSQIDLGGPHNDYVSALASVKTDSATDMVTAGMPAAVAASQKVIGEQQTTMATANEMLAQARGSTTVDTGEEANEINHLQENSDTQAYISGALDRQHDTVKTVLTKSIPSVSGAAKLIGDAGISDAPTDRATHVERIVKETSNALASTTLTKTTGVKMEQQSEGLVHQAKFMLHQAGSSIAHEAPFIRSTARVHVTQGQILLSEADSHDIRGQWEYHLVDKSIGQVTTDYHVLAKGKLVQTAKTAQYFGQEGTTHADKQSITIDVGDGKAQIHVAGDKLTIQLGAACIVMDPSGRIDLNPTVKPVPVVVDVKYTEAPPLDMGSDKATSILPTRGARNPVPCAAPYTQPKDIIGTLGLGGTA